MWCVCVCGGGGGVGARKKYDETILQVFNVRELDRQMMMMMIWCFTSLSTLFKSYQDDGRVIMKGSVQ